MEMCRFAVAARRAFLRNCKPVLPVFLAFGAIALSAQQPNFTGQWRGVYNNVSITLTVQPNLQYTETEGSGALMTTQTGSIKLASPNTMIFTVVNWAPRTMPVYHATGTTGGYYTQKPTTKPPGGSYIYVFNGPNSFTMTDQTYHGSVTMNRVQ